MENYKENIKLYEIYYSMIEDPDFLDYLIYKLYKLNEYKPFKDRLYRLIYMLEDHQLKKFDNRKKLIQSIDCNFDVETVNGEMNHCTQFHRTRPYNAYKLILEGRHEVICADKHLLYADIEKGRQDWFFAKDLKVGDFVYSDEGWLKILDITKQDYKIYMCDLSVEGKTE